MTQRKYLIVQWFLSPNSILPAIFGTDILRVQTCRWDLDGIEKSENPLWPLSVNGICVWEVGMPMVDTTRTCALATLRLDKIYVYQ